MLSLRTNDAPLWMRKAFTLTLFVGALIAVICLRIPVHDMRWEVLLDYRAFILHGLLISVALTVISFALSAIPAGLLAFGRISRNRLARYLSGGLVEIVRSIPELMVIFWIFFAVPMIVGQSLDKYTSGVIALAVVNTAYLSEAIRAGIQSVPTGLSLAGFAVGMTPWQVRAHIVLPIALRNMLPELRNRFVSLFKSTSLLYVIGIIEFFNALVIVNNREIVPFAAMITAGLGYFGCAYLLELGTRWLSRRR